MNCGNVYVKGDEVIMTGLYEYTAFVCGVVSSSVPVLLGRETISSDSNGHVDSQQYLPLTRYGINISFII